VSISSDNKFMACVDMSNNHNVVVFDVASGAKQYEEKGDTNYIYDCAFSQAPGDYSLMTSGNRHLYFWDFKKHEKKRGIAGNFGIISHQVCTWDAEGTAYSGGADGRIFVWKDRAAVDAKEAHKGYIGAIRAVNGKLFTGGKDNRVCEWSLPDLSALRTFDFDARPLSLDFIESSGNILVSLRNGDIREMENGSDSTAIM
jgi:WD40 repeat protein